MKWDLEGLMGDSQGQRSEAEGKTPLSPSGGKNKKPVPRPVSVTAVMPSRSSPLSPTRFRDILLAVLAQPGSPNNNTTTTTNNSNNHNHKHSNKKSSSSSTSGSPGGVLLSQLPQRFKQVTGCDLRECLFESASSSSNGGSAAKGHRGSHEGGGRSSKLKLQVLLSQLDYLELVQLPNGQRVVQPMQAHIYNAGTGTGVETGVEAGVTSGGSGFAPGSINMQQHLAVAASPKSPKSPKGTETVTTTTTVTTSTSTTPLLLHIMVHRAKGLSTGNKNALLVTQNCSYSSAFQALQTAVYIFV